MPRSLSSSVQSELIRNHNHSAVKPPSLTSRSLKKYLSTRFSSLFVSKEERSQYTWGEMLNPFGELKHMTLKNWNYFLMGFAAWTWDSVDYVAVNLNTGNLARDLHVSVKDITWGITPFVHFLASPWVACFGFSLATSLDDSPVACRGVLSGIFQQGYSFGYILVVIFNRAITYNSPFGWRALFWFSACPPVLLIIWRLCLPETDTYRRQRADAQAKRKLNPDRKWFRLSDDTKYVFRTYWLTLIYLVLLMSGFTFMSHGSQDLYPTLLSKQLEFSPDRSTVTNCVAYLGAILGGIVCGHASTFIGRRLTIIIAVILGGAMIYPWAYLRSSAINAGAFFMQAAVQGAWAVIPIHLSELSPPAYRSLATGLTYQLGNMVSSASSTIESTIGERFPITTASGEPGFDYSKVMSLFIACVFGYVLLVTFLGPENRNADFDVDRDTIYEEEINENEEEVDVESIKPEEEFIEHS
ncbi:hypothetical protein HF325_005097 [Metschnikowia pulcherrima]|uniref:Major facilitator superfamily (MFS) profile domain-containing protein n=1 Tax=Metschnikowia pulcherrima TaxID=27326 RepID=A0A8H7GN13_9ASCO|nr:hypothetical protein HF325_005097 [Metschnikowia pulcherrima]